MRSRVRRRGPPALVILCVASACAPGSDDTRVASHTTRDSAGIQIVENTAPAWRSGAGWSIAPEPAVEIGVAEGEPPYMLYSVTDARRMSDGRIAVLNNGSREVRFYDADGSFLGAVGGEGEGPGEFRSPWKVRRLAGDTLVVWDAGYPGSLSRFDESGNFVDRAPLDRARLTEALPQWFAEGGELLPDGTFLLHLFDQEAPNMGREGPFRSEGAWIHAPADVSRVDTIGFFPGMEQFGYAYEGRVTSNGRPFGVSTLVTGGGDPVRIYVADTGRYEISVFSSSGDLLKIVRRSYEPRPVTDDDISDIEDQYRRIADRVPESQRQRYVEFLEVVDYPESGPVLGVMNVDTEGDLWVFEPQRIDGNLACSVFDSDGVWLGRVRLPAPIRIFEIGPDYVLGMRRNELGVETVLLYELHRG